MNRRLATVMVFASATFTSCGDPAGNSAAPSDSSTTTSMMATTVTTDSVPISTSQPSDAADSTSSTPSASSVPYPEATGDVIVEDGTPASLDEMFEGSDLVATGTVRSTYSLGRPDSEEDPLADEYVAIEIALESTLKGRETRMVVLGWDAIGVNEAGKRSVTLLSNGLPPPRNGDRLLLFLIDPDPAFVEWMGGHPTHQPIQLDGIAFLDEQGMITLAEGGSPLVELGSLEAVLAELE